MWCQNVKISPAPNDMFTKSKFKLSLICHAQLLAVTIRVIWLVAFSVEVILPSLVRQTINQRQFELTLREHIIGGWRDLDILTPHEAHHSSRD